MNHLKICLQCVCVLCKGCDVWCERVDQIIRTQEFLAIRKTHEFGSYVGAQEFFIGQLVMVQFGMSQSVRKRRGFGLLALPLIFVIFIRLVLRRVYVQGGKERVFIRLELGGISFLNGSCIPSPRSWLFSSSSFGYQLLHRLFRSMVSISSLNMAVHDHVQFGGVKKVS